MDFNWNPFFGGSQGQSFESRFSWIESRWNSIQILSSEVQKHGHLKVDYHELKVDGIQFKSFLLRFKRTVIWK
jgi:hypothetical protein